MAIKALETLEEFEGAQIITGDRLNGRTYAYKCGLEVEKRKALEQKPRKGHWKYDYTSADGHKVYHCSECGCCLKPKHSEPLNSFKWCSLCGADMREDKE